MALVAASTAGVHVVTRKLGERATAKAEHEIGWLLRHS
jgi:hypothetical protein